MEPAYQIKMNPLLIKNELLMNYLLETAVLI